MSPKVWLLAALVVALHFPAGATASSSRGVAPVPRFHAVLSVIHFRGRRNVLLNSLELSGVRGLQLRVSCRCLRFRGRIRVTYPARGVKLYRGVRWILQPGRRVSIRVYRPGELGRFLVVGARLGKRPRLVFKSSGCLASLSRPAPCPKHVKSPRPGVSVPVQPISPPSLPTARLGVALTGSGSGNVIGADISCPGACEFDYPLGTVVPLTAKPSQGSIFNGWNGACTGMGPCTVTMAARETVTADFTAMHTLVISVAGSGPGTVTGPGISCSGACQHNYPVGTVVPLTATPGRGTMFDGWSGACTGMGACEVTMDAHETVTADFTLLHTLVVTVTGAGSGGVTASGISCPGTCQHNYPVGTVVPVTATPAPGSVFAGWGGACTGTDPCNVTMSDHEILTADFEPSPP